MNNTIYCSIIISVYNGEQYIIDNMNSLRKQTFQNFEAIYVNDGSTDQSAEILKRECANDSRFKCFSKPNGGIASAMKFGIEQASSEYIVLLDQDDYAMHNRLELTVHAFEHGAELIMGDYEIVDEKLNSTGKIVKIPDFIDSENILLEQLKRSYILGSALAFKNKHDFSFIANSGGATDFDISLKMLLNGYKFTYIQEVLIQYRVHEHNTSANYQNQKRDLANVLDQFSPQFLVQTLKGRGYKENDIYTTLAILYLFLDQLMLADELFAKVDVTKEEISEEYYFYFAVLKFKQKKLNESADIFARLMNKCTNPAIVNNYGYFKVYEGNMIQAETYFLQSIENNSDYIDGTHNIMQCQKGNTNIEQYRFTTRMLRKTLTHKSIVDK